MTSQLPPTTTDTSDWTAEIAEGSGVPVERVIDILRAQRIPGARLLTSRAKLRIDAVHFAGIKKLRDVSDGSDGSEGSSRPRVLQPFTFSHGFAQPVTAFASRGTNDAGKSSIINVATWGLKGRSTLQSDVRGWIREAALQFTIGDERILVAWSDFDDVPRGHVLVLGAAAVDWDGIDSDAVDLYRSQAADEQGAAGDGAADPAAHGGDRQTSLDAALPALVTQGAVQVTSFEGDADFASVMAAVMMPRLGFETIEAWQRNSKATEADDGGIVNHGWALWSQALAITDPSVKVTLGDSAPSAVPLLQMYLGTTWGPSATASKARIGEITGELTSLNRRKRAAEEQLKLGVSQIEKEIAAAEAEIAAAPVLATLEEIDDALVDAARNAAAAADANSKLLEAGAEYGRLSKMVVQAMAEEAALSEAAVTQRFWHSLKPSCCPRCDAKVDDERWKREQEGTCSLCDSPVDVAAEGTELASHGVAVLEDDPEEDPDELLIARERTLALREQLAVADAVHDTLMLAKASTDRLVAAGKSDPRLAGADPRARRALEMRVATLRGRLEERQSTHVDAADLDGRAETLAVLESAHKVAKKKRDREQAAMLAEVSERLTVMGQALGINQLEKAELLGNTHLPVRKGGAKSNFGGLTDGERLRLKIALVIALLHVGTAAGVGRHPGVLLIDSLAREELNPDNAQTLLEQLSKVAEENDLQIITSSALGERVAAALPDGATRLSNDDGLMW